MSPTMHYHHDTLMKIIQEAAGGHGRQLCQTFISIRATTSSSSTVFPYMHTVDKRLMKNISERGQELDES